MATYDFSTLNSSDLEELVCDLLNAIERANNSAVTFKTFKDGKDKGIDIRFSTHSNDNEIVGQVKHYYRSGFDALLTVLKSQERRKVLDLNPQKYIFATSVDLSVSNSEEIRGLFAPFIKSLSDIFGCKDLNRMIDDHPTVLDNHFKLWFSGSAVLRKLLNYNIDGRSSEFTEIELKKKLRLYVNTTSLDEARRKLKESNLVIITGEPGSGKTTTAEMLLYDMIKDGHELVYIYDDIREAEPKLTLDNKKQVFYYDDFLGHNSLEIAKAKGSETSLIKILRKINHYENKKFILTTRTFILSAAIEDSEKLRQFNIKAKESKLQLSVYSENIKRQILQNHAEESSISAELKAVLKSKTVEAFTIRHRNFSPRSIDFITRDENVGHFSAEEFERFIVQNFDSPDEIWRHAYEQQIGNIERILLNTMVSFGNSVSFDELELAFKYRMDYEVQNNNFERPLNGFLNSFKRLEGGFIVEFSDIAGRYQFINPSLTDFLVNHLRKNKDEVLRISESCCFVTQLISGLFPIDRNDYSNVKTLISPILKNRLLFDSGFYIRSVYKDYERLLLVILVYYYIDIAESEKTVLELLSAIENCDFIVEEHKIGFYLQHFLEDLKSTLIIRKVGEIGNILFPPIFYDENDLDELLRLMKFSSKKFGVNLSTVISKNPTFDFEEKFTSLLNEKIEGDIEDLLEFSMAQDFVNAREQETQDIVDFFESLGVEIHCDMQDYSKYDWVTIGLENYFREQMRRDD